LSIIDCDLPDLSQCSPQQLVEMLKYNFCIISNIAERARGLPALESINLHLVLACLLSFLHLDHEIGTEQATNISINEPGPSSNSSNRDPVRSTTTMLPVISTSTSVPAGIDTDISNVADKKGPRILNQPKVDWHVRNFKDLVPKQKLKNSAAKKKRAATAVKTTVKQTIGLLQGIGNQRSLIKLQVS
jgi:hypothetical protein